MADILELQDLAPYAEDSNDAEILGLSTVSINCNNTVVEA